MTHIELIEKVAKSINGPFHPVPEGSPYTLDQLRDIRWMQVNSVERKLCLASAKAAISTIRAALKEPDQLMLGAASDYSAKTFTVCGAGYWRVMLAASALGEQSDRTEIVSGDGAVWDETAPNSHVFQRREQSE